MPAIQLDGTRLNTGDLARVADGANVTVSASGLEAMAETNALILHAAKSGRPVYGVTTGLGPRVTKALSADEIEAFAINTVRGRAHAVGTPLSREAVRGAMTVRLNTLLSGASGASPGIARHLQACLNADLVPEVGETASIGAADLLWGGTMGLALIGEGSFLGKSKSAEALAQAGIDPVRLGPRDGLALASHSCFSAALAALGHHGATIVWQAAQTAAALTLEGFRGNLSPLNPAVLATRHQPGQIEAAQDLSARLAGSGLHEPGAARRLQDPLSMRNIVQVHGSAFAALQALEETVLGEINGASDNPIVLPETGEILSGGGYLNPYLGVVLIGANQALVQMAAQTVSRSARMLAGRFTDLPNGLATEEAGVAGLGPLLKVAEALFAEIAHLATPPIVYPASSADGVEDTITNAAIPAKSLSQIVERLSKLIAFEMIVAVQAIEMRGVAIAPGLQPVVTSVRAMSPKVTADRPMTRDLEALAEKVCAGDFAQA